MIGLLVLWGWFRGMHQLTDWAGNGIAMKPNTALCATAAGLALAMHGILGRHVKLPVQLLGGFVAALGSATILQHLTGSSFGIDSMLLHEDNGPRAAAAPGRMGPPSSTGFALIGLGLLGITAQPGSRVRRLCVLLGSCAIAIAVLALMGYLYQAELIYAIPQISGISIQSALVIMLLGIGVVASVPERMPTRVVLQESATGLLGRRAIPFLLVPVFLGLIRISGERTGLYDSAFGTALQTSAEIGLLTGLLWWTLRVLARHEEAKEANHQRVIDTLESITDGFISLSPDWRFTYVNVEAARLLHRDRLGLLGRSIWDVFPEAMKRPIYTRLSRVLAERKPYDVEDYNPHTSRWFLVRGQPGPEGGVAVFFQDITQRKLAEIAVATHERLLATVTEHARVGLVIVSHEHRYLYANRAYAELLELPSHQIVGHRMQDVLTEVYHNQIRPHLTLAFTGERVEYELTLPPRAAEIDGRYFSMICEPQLENGMVQSVVMAIADLTEHKRAEQELRMHKQRLEQLVQDRTEEIRATYERLRHAEQLASIGTLAAGLGHDMSNILLPIDSRLNSLRDAAVTARAHGDLDAIKAAMDYLRNLSRSLRSLARDPTSVEPTEIIDLADWLPRTVPLLKAILPRNVRLMADVLHVDGSDSMEVQASAAQLTQVIYNLVHNAGEALSHSASVDKLVKVTVQRIRDHESGEPRVQLTVQDNGPGMTEEIRRRCLQPFFTTKKKSLAGGMGLSLVASIIERLKGEIEVESTPQLAGASFDGELATSFRITLPAVAQLDRNDQISPTALASMKSAAIWITDVRLRSIIEWLVRALGVAAYTVSDASEIATDSLNLLIVEAMHLPEVSSLPTANCRVMVLGDLKRHSHQGNLHMHICDRDLNPVTLREALTRALSDSSSQEQFDQCPVESL